MRRQEQPRLSTTACSTFTSIIGKFFRLQCFAPWSFCYPQNVCIWKVSISKYAYWWVQDREKVKDKDEEKVEWDEKIANANGSYIHSLLWWSYIVHMTQIWLPLPHYPLLLSKTWLAYRFRSWANYVPIPSPRSWSLRIAKLEINEKSHHPYSQVSSMQGIILTLFNQQVHCASDKKLQQFDHQPTGPMYRMILLQPVFGISKVCSTYRILVSRYGISWSPNVVRDFTVA